MRVLIDEMHSYVVAQQLRQRGHDALAVQERSDLIHRLDDIVFAAAQSEMRAVVTENVIDFRFLGSQIVRRGEVHCGLIFTTNRTFPRSARGYVGRLVNALDALMSSEDDISNLEVWLRLP